MLCGRRRGGSLHADCMVLTSPSARPRVSRGGAALAALPASAGGHGDLTPHQAMRASHRQAVLAQLRRGATTQTAIARETGLSQATVSRVLAEFRQADLIETTSQRRRGATRGRVPAIVRLRSGGRYLVGIEFEDSRCVAAVTDLRLHIEHRAEPQRRVGSTEEMVESAVAAFERATHGVERERICAVGVGTPGVVDMRTGMLRTLTWPGVRLDDVPLAYRLRARLGLPVVVANRSRAAAAGERFGGAGRESQDLVYIWIGYGI